MERNKMLYWSLNLTNAIFFVVSLFWLFYFENGSSIYKQITFNVFPILFALTYNLSYIIYNNWKETIASNNQSKYFSVYLLFLINFLVCFILVGFNFYSDIKLVKLLYSTIEGLLFFNNLYIGYNSYFVEAIIIIKNGKPKLSN